MSAREKILISALVLLGFVTVFLILNNSEEEREIRDPAVSEAPELVQEEADVAVPVTLGDEDCLSFNADEIEIRHIPRDDQYLMVSGRGSHMMLFDTRDGARIAALTLKHYDLDSHCFAIRPNPGLMYFKSQGDIPEGAIPGEDCIRISDPSNLSVREISSTFYQVLDGSSIHFSAKSREEADRIVEVIQHYNAGFTCYVDRPDASMFYLRR